MNTSHIQGWNETHWNVPNGQYDWLLTIFLPEAVAIATGNILILVAFTGTRLLRKRKNFLLVNLAVADLLVGSVSMVFFLVVNCSGDARLLRFVQSYNIFTGQDVFFGTASIFGLTSVAAERMYATYFPLKHRVLSKTVYGVIMAAVWGHALLLAVTALFSNNTVFIAIMIPSFLVSLFVMAICYSLIWYKVSRSTQRQKRGTGDDRKLTVTLVIVTSLSLVTWLPFQVINMMFAVCGVPDAHCTALPSTTVVLVTKFLQYSNSAVNPVVYAFRMAEFTKALKQMSACAAVRRKAHAQEAKEKTTSTLLMATVPTSKTKGKAGLQCKEK